MKPSFRHPILAFGLCFFTLLMLVSRATPPVVAQADLPTATPTATETAEQTTLAITEVRPTAVSNLSDSEIVITGTGFVSGATVVVSRSGGLATTFVSDMLLRALLPAGTVPGTYDITVINPDATSATLTAALQVTGPAAGTATPVPTNTPAPTAFVRPLLIVNSYGASSAEITPGSNLDFEMTFGNAGGIQATNVVATFISGDFVARNTGGVIAIGTLGPGQTHRFWQPLAASKDLTGGGIATLQVKVDYTDFNGTAYTDTFNLTFPVARPAVSGPGPTSTPTATPTFAARQRPQLIVTSYETSESLLQPGLNFTLSLSVQNQGNANAERITMIVGGGTASGGSVDGTPVPGGVSGGGGEFTKFAPVGASNVQTLGGLGQGDTLQATMNFIVNAATEAGAYPIKVSFVYEDGANGNFVDDQVITLLVVKRPSVAINFYTPPPPFFVGEPGSLPLQIVNTGTKTAVLGNFTVSSEGETIENGSAFVGNLEPGGFYPLDALLFPASEGAKTLTLTISYTDDFGQPQVITQTLDIEVMPPMIIEEPTEGFPEEVPPPEPEPETVAQKIWRFLLGLIGLSSGSSQPQSDMPGGDMGPGGFDPGMGDPGIDAPIDSGITQ